MSDINKIDQLLKDNFVDFTPDAPDVWQGIQQGVQAAQVTGATTAAVKGTSIVVKIIATVAVSASLVTGYVLLNDTEQSQKEEVSTNVSNELTTTNEPEQNEAVSNTESPVTSVSGEEKSQTSFNQITINTNTSIPAGNKHNMAEKTADDKTAHETIFRTQSVADTKTEEKTTTSAPVTPFVRESVKRDVDTDVSTEELEESTDEKIEPATESHSTENNELFIPNIITPNGDGKNDRFVIPVENEQFYFLTIMDKNGNKVFESNDKNINWDGRDYKSGLMCPQGTYFMIFRYQLKGMQTEQTKIGKVTLL